MNLTGKDAARRIVLLILTASPAAMADQVVTNLNSSGAGSLAQAIADAASTDTISFQAGLTGIITPNPLAIDKNLTINGPGSGVITISGQSIRRIFVISPSISTINDLSIVNGKALTGEKGGGIQNGGTLTVNHCVITGCNSSNGGGGGVANRFNGTLTMNNCTVSGNTASQQGAGVNNESGNVMLNNCTISNNAAVGSVSFPGGGGIANDSGTVTLTNCTVSGNTTKNDGGGITNSLNCTLNATGCTISGNSSEDDGGGLQNIGTANLTNCTITGNFQNGTFGAKSAGAILSVGFGTSPIVTLINCTVTANYVINSTGADGIYINTNNGGSQVRLKNTLVAANGATNFGKNNGSFVSQSNNLDSDGSSGFTNGVDGNIVGTNAVRIDPNIGPLANNGGATLTHALYVGSPALNAGTSTGAPTTDQRGLPRPAPAYCGGTATPDIGAFESQDGGFVVTTLADSGIGSLRNVLATANTLSCSKDITFAVTGTITLTTGQLNITKNVRILGPGAGALTISGNNAGRIFQIPVTSPVVTIADVTIQSGNATDGGGIWSLGNLTLTRCVITGNTATSTGGGGVESYNIMSATDCTFSGNSATGGTPLGGGVLNNSGVSFALNRCTLSGNNANQGAGLASKDFPITMTNCTISGNTGQTGAAVYSSGSQVTLESCTIVSNSSSAGANCQGSFKYRNTIAANTGGANFGAGASYQSLGHNISSDGTGNLTLTGDKPNTNPLLGALADHGGPTKTHELLLGSPAIDAGDPVTFPTIDQRGAARPTDGDANGTQVADIGAFETATQLPEDFDRDGDVDSDDLAVFNLCKTGAALPGPPAGCMTGWFQFADTDHDNDLDMDDYGVFQRCFSGANHPANPNCAN